MQLDRFFTLKVQGFNLSGAKQVAQAIIVYYSSASLYIHELQDVFFHIHILLIQLLNQSTKSRPRISGICTYGPIHIGLSITYH